MSSYDQWLGDDFLPQALAWTDTVLDGADRPRLEEPSWSRVRPWGCVLAIPAEGGTVWFKAVPDGGAEPALHTVLAEEVADHVAPLLAVDEERRWLLLGDAGLSLGDGVDDAGAPDLCASGPFRAAMTAYADVQGRMAHRIDELVTRGLPDARPHAMPGVFDRLHESLSRTAFDAADTDAIDLLGRIAGARSVVVDLASRLETSGSVDHNDLHPWNVMRTAPDAPPVFLDWGDAMAAHPYASLLVPVRIARLASPEAGDAVVEAYATGCDASFDHDVYEAALRLAVVARAWTWQRSLASDRTNAEYGDAALKWFARILDPDPLDADRD
ncbi:MAG: phosphotransferase family protein [Propionibacteriaceae bacterium]